LDRSFPTLRSTLRFGLEPTGSGERCLLFDLRGPSWSRYVLSLFSFLLPSPPPTQHNATSLSFPRHLPPFLTLSFPQQPPSSLESNQLRFLSLDASLTLSPLLLFSSLRFPFAQPRTKEQQVKAEKRLLSRQSAKKAKLAELGIDYQMEGVEYVSLNRSPFHSFSCLSFLPSFPRLVASTSTRVLTSFHFSLFRFGLGLGSSRSRLLSGLDFLSSCVGFSFVLLCVWVGCWICRSLHGYERFLFRLYMYGLNTKLVESERGKRESGKATRVRNRGKDSDSSETITHITRAELADTRSGPAVKSCERVF